MPIDCAMATGWINCTPCSIVSSPDSHTLVALQVKNLRPQGVAVWDKTMYSTGSIPVSFPTQWSRTQSGNRNSIYFMNNLCDRPQSQISSYHFSLQPVTELLSGNEISYTAIISSMLDLNTYAISSTKIIELSYMYHPVTSSTSTFCTSNVKLTTLLFDY